MRMKNVDGRKWARSIWPAFVVVAGLLLAGCEPRELLSAVSLAPEDISPNADGVADATRIAYRLGRNATVSIFFQSDGDTRRYFRNAQPRSAGEYAVLFSGVIDGRLLPDGVYRWVVDATDDAGQSQSIEGTLRLSGGETTPPEILRWTIQPKVFTPNRDGISDRATINFYLNKSAALYVTLQNALCNGSTTPPAGSPDLNCTPFPLAERASTGETRKPGEEGLHEFDYDAGVDLGADPPPDGLYVVTARVEDAVGQVATVTDTLEIEGGGVPRAEIVDGQVEFSTRSAILGDTMYFTLTVENYGAVPIRTSGPLSGYVYSDANQTFAWPGYAEQSGVFRVGIGFETMKTNYPFRWAIGGAADLVVQEIDGQPYYYLPPGRRATVTGGIKLTEVPARNPVRFFGALIHEDVQMVNQNVDPNPVLITKP